MTRTVTAMFDTREDAEAGRARLEQAGIHASSVNIHDKSTQGFSNDQYSTTSHEDRGIWGSIKNAFMPDEDRHTYEEGIRRGGYVLSADVDDSNIDRAVAALEESKSIDVDGRAQGWRNEGWDYAPAAGSAMFGNAGTDTMRDKMPSTDEERIPIIEENLVVGKRDVDRGGVRVRSYVTETPVSEQVRLRNERVEVERRPVDREMSSTDADAFREKTISMTATGEEAVVGKNARVVEEVVVRKTADETTETVSDTVRKTEVDIDRDATDDRIDTKTGTTRTDSY